MSMVTETYARVKIDYVGFIEELNKMGPIKSILLDRILILRLAKNGYPVTLLSTVEPEFQDQFDNAMSGGSIEGVVKYDVSQALTDVQKETARANIEAVDEARVNEIVSSSGGSGLIKATEADAIQGIDDTKFMTPLQVLNSISSNSPFKHFIKVLTSDDINIKYISIPNDITDNQNIQVYVDNCGIKGEPGVDYSSSGNDIYWGGYDWEFTLQIGDKLSIFYR